MVRLSSLWTGAAIAALVICVAWADGGFKINQGVFGGGNVPANPASNHGSGGWGNPWKYDDDNCSGGKCNGDDSKGHGPGKPGHPDKGHPDLGHPPKPDGPDNGFRPPAAPLVPGFGFGGYNGPLSPEEARLYQTVAHATLTGFEETPPICTEARGEFTAWIPWDGDRIDWQLIFYGCHSTPTSASIHLGLPGDDGPVVAQLCSSDAGRRRDWGCDECRLIRDDDLDDLENRNRIVLEGTLRRSDIQAIPSSGLDDGDLSCLIKAMQFISPSGQSAVYVEVETEEFPDGEVRGQLLARNFAKMLKKGHGDGGLGKKKLGDMEGFKFT